MTCLALANFLLGQGLIQDTTALAAVALVGFIFGRRSCRVARTNDVTLLIELAGAQTTSKNLESIALRARGEAEGCLRSLASFQTRIGAMQNGRREASWPSLRAEADMLLGPLMKLSATLSTACDDLRRRQAQITAYASERIDRETGLCNRRTLLEHLAALASAHADGAPRLSICLLRLEPSDRDPAAEMRLVTVISRLLEQSVRRSDIVARVNARDFAIVMSKTPLEAAMEAGERLTQLAHRRLDCCLSIATAEACQGDTPESLLRRAELALGPARNADELLTTC